MTRRLARKVLLDRWKCFRRKGTVLRAYKRLGLYCVARTLREGLRHDGSWVPL